MMDRLPEPQPLEPRTSALFLDFDGTLIGFGATPMAVEVPRDLRDLLGALREATGGALAVVSGRRIETLDVLLAPLVLPLAGLHGLERRDAAGRIHHPAAQDTAGLGAIEASLRAFAARGRGLLVEDKGMSLALHYRAAPERAQEVLEFARRLEAELPSQLVMQRGHAVIEIRPAGADKGTAIAGFMREAPFEGRRPVFVGDDRTDEHGFAIVNALHGVSVKVGAGQTEARARLPDPAAVGAWLGAGAARGASVTV